MANKLMACRVLKAAEEDLQTVIHSLIDADPEQLECAQRLLERLVATLGAIETSSRLDSSLPIKNALQGFRSTLGQAEGLTSIALSNIERHAALAGVSVAPVTGIIHLEA